MKKAYTKTEMEAYVLLNQGRSWFTQSKGDEIEKAADKIIEMAERIKAERLSQIRQIGLNE